MSDLAEKKDELDRIAHRCRDDMKAAGATGVAVVVVVEGAQYLNLDADTRETSCMAIRLVKAACDGT